MEVACDIVIEFDDAEKVKTVLKSIEVDDFEFVESKANCKKLEAQIKATSVSSLLNTIDDYLACVSVVINMLDKD
jgi:tRNA threonylcarbamoyladenosine modification (KEOPS) complex  Pcc1 subunit